MPHLPKMPVLYPACLNISGMTKSPACRSSSLRVLPRMRQWPVWSPVINAQRDGAQTVQPA